MASFNQVPSGQTSIAAQSISLSLGSAAHASTITFNSIKYSFFGTGYISLDLIGTSAVQPSWRRAKRQVKNN